MLSGRGCSGRFLMWKWSPLALFLGWEVYTMAPEPSESQQIPRRHQLQSLLQILLGSRNVYFQPPENVRMSYPAIVYARSTSSTDHADNKVYRRKKGWTVTHISNDPDDPTPDKIEDLPLCSFDRHFVAENLNHNVYTLYF